METHREYVGYLDEWDGTEVLTDEEIVRCRDCKHFTPQGAITFFDYSRNEDFCDYIRGYMLQIGPDGFCAWGERK